jgi:hypothetical protein
MRVVIGLTALHTIKDKYHSFKYPAVPHYDTSTLLTISLHTVQADYNYSIHSNGSQPGPRCDQTFSGLNSFLSP